MSKSDEKPESDEKSGGREWTEVDNLYGEWIARDLHDRISAEGEHFSYAHQRKLFDPLADFLLGAPPECTHPGCEAERFLEEDAAGSFVDDDDHAAEDAERFFAEETESWWQRWFRSSGGGDDGESGSSD